MKKIKGILDYLLNKKSVKNGLWIYALQIFNTVIPLITLPYITRILGAENYGTFSLQLNLTAYLQVVVEYGFGLSATRQVALAPPKKSLSKLFTQVMASRIFLFLLSLSAVLIYIAFNNQSTTENVCLFILVFALFAYCFQQNWIFQGKQEMKFISISTMIARTITTVSIFAFIKQADQVVLYCMLYSFSPFLTSFIGSLIAVKRYKLRLVKISIKDLVEALTSGLYIFFTQLSSKVFGAIGVTFLGIYTSNFEVGIYSAIYKLPYVLLLLWIPISQIVYPITSKKIVESFDLGDQLIKKIAKYCLLFFGLISVCVGILGKEVIYIAFGPEYSAYYYIIYPLLIWILLGICNNFIGVQTMVGSGHDKEYSKCFQIGVVFTIVCNYLFIKNCGMLGAAIAPAVSEGLLTLILVISLKKIKQKNQLE